MITREKLKADYERNLAELERKEAAMEELPFTDELPPSFIHVSSRQETWVKYDLTREPDSMELAVEMIEGVFLPFAGSFPPVSYRSSGGIAYVGPEGKYGGREGELKWEAESGIVLVQNAGEGYRTDSLQFFLTYPGIRIELVFNLPYKLRSVVIMERDNWGNPKPGTGKLGFVRLAERTLTYAGVKDGNMRHIAAFADMEELRRNLGLIS